MLVLFGNVNIQQESLLFCRVDEPYLSPNHPVLAKVSDDIGEY